MDRLKASLAQIDVALKEARFAEARAQFFVLAEQKWPRENILELCQVARRLNLPYLILRWLHPIIHPQVELATAATDLEKSMYAVGLTRIGAFAEAQQILGEVSKEQPDKQLALGLLNIWQWNYGQALRPLKKYLTFFKPTEYAYLIGLLNLAASYVSTDRLDESVESAQIILGQCSDDRYPLIRANTLEVLAQSQLRSGQLNEAESNLNRSAEILKKSGSDYELFVNKWKVILQMKRGQTVDLEIQQMKDFAKKRRVFEANRELDLYQCLAQNNEPLFLQIYFGTRFAGYRKRMRNLFGYDRRPPRESLIQFGAETKGPIINPSQLNLTPMTKKLLQIALSDFYRPIQLGEVFKELYPDEFFNPQTSTARLYRVYRRLVDEVTSLALPIQLEWKQKQISWKSQSSFQLQIERRAEISSLANFPQEIFSVSDVMDHFSISKSAAYRLLTEEMQTRRIHRRGPGYFRKVA